MRQPNGTCSKQCSPCRKQWPCFDCCTHHGHACHQQTWYLLGYLPTLRYMQRRSLLAADRPTIFQIFFAFSVFSPSRTEWASGGAGNSALGSIVSSAPYPALFGCGRTGLLFGLSGWNVLFARSPFGTDVSCRLPIPPLLSRRRDRRPRYRTLHQLSTFPEIWRIGNDSSPPSVSDCWHPWLFGRERVRSCSGCWKRQEAHGRSAAALRDSKEKKKGGVEGVPVRVAVWLAARRRRFVKESCRPSPVVVVCDCSPPVVHRPSTVTNKRF